MEIHKTQAGDGLTLALSGRLDTTTAPALESELNASLDGVRGLTLGAAVLLPHFFKKHSLLRLRPRLPRLAEAGQYVANGFGVGSAFIFQAVVMLVFNKLLLSSGAEVVACVAVYGVIYNVSTIPFAVFDGAAGAVSTVTPILAGDRGFIRRLPALLEERGWQDISPD